MSKVAQVVNQKVLQKVRKKVRVWRVATIVSDSKAQKT